MGRDRRYRTDAERQRAYRLRQAEERGRYRAEEWARMREALRGGKATTTRKAVSAKLIKVLGMLSSPYAGERDNAARMATQILKDAGLTWYDVLDIEEPEQ